jgi:hypothetical protein
MFEHVVDEPMQMKQVNESRVMLHAEVVNSMQSGDEDT